MNLEFAFIMSLVLSALLCSLVSGLVFAFAIVVMPGIKSLKDREFIRAFQVMDGIIQKNQPIFIIVWAGSIVMLLISAILGLWQLAGVPRVILLITALTYTVGVHLPTIIINIPLNNKLQKFDVDSANESLQRKMRNEFETRWNFWNSFRTLVSIVVTVFLMILLFIL